MFALPSAFSLLASYGSLCSDVLSRISICTYALDYETLTLGAVLAFIAGGEFVLGFKRKRGGELFWESGGQRLLRRSGMIAMLVGSVVSIYGFSKTYSAVISSMLPWTVSDTYGLSFYAGLIVLTLGAALILGSRYIKIKPIKSATAKLLLQRN